MTQTPTHDLNTLRGERSQSSLRRELWIVGDRALGARLQDAWLETIVNLPDMLSMLGRLAHEQPRLILIRPDAMQRHAERTWAAMAQLAPHTERWIIVEPADEPIALAAMQHGADRYFIAKLDEDKLCEALGQFQHQTLNLRDEQTEDQPQSESHLAEMQPAASGTSDMTDMLHDLPMVEQMLTRRAGIADRGLALLRQRLNDPQLQFSPEPMPSAKANVAIEVQDTLAGYLVSDHHDARALADHAHWLGRWMSLKRHIAQLQNLALRDELTRLWNRRYFDHFLTLILDRAQRERFQVTLMLFDIDNFKSYNDNFGHPAGDEILRETARLMQGAVRQHDVVARVGGDEFAVIFWDAEPPRQTNSQHPQSVRLAAERFERAICEHHFPKLAEQAHDTLTISGGLASYPWDALEPQQLIEIADEMMLASKRAGKNAITFGPGIERACNESRPSDD